MEEFVVLKIISSELIFKAAIFFFINSTIKVSSKPFYPYKHILGLFSSTRMQSCMSRSDSVLGVKDLQRPQTVKSTKIR